MFITSSSPIFVKLVLDREWPTTRILYNVIGDAIHERNLHNISRSLWGVSTADAEQQDKSAFVSVRRSAHAPSAPLRQTTNSEHEIERGSEWFGSNRHTGLHVCISKIPRLQYDHQSTRFLIVLADIFRVIHTTSEGTIRGLYRQ